MNEYYLHKVENQVNIGGIYSLFKVHYKNGFCIPGEAHDFWEFLYVMKGSVCITADERVYNLNEGEIIFHKPLEMHKISVEQEKGATLLIVAFELTGTMARYLENKVFHLTTEQQQILNAMLRYIRTQIHTQKIPEGTPDDQRYLYPAKNSPLYLQRVITYLYQLLLSLGDDGSVAATLSTKDALSFRKAVQYMAEHIHAQPSVYEIANACNISESGLKRIFAKYAGLSVHKYFLKLKFKAATELLQSGMNINEVADRLNFSSQSYFSVSFKREIGENPSQVK